MNQQNLPGEPRGLGRLLDEVDDDVVQRRFRDVRQGVLEQELVLERHQRVAAAGGHRRLADEARRGARPIPQHVVPEDLHALLRDGKRNPLHGAGHAVAAGNEIRGRGDAPGRLVDPLRLRGAAVRRINDQLVIRISLQQPLVPLGQLRRILAHVRRRDREQRLVARERIGMMLSAAVTGEAGLGR